jgi:hypothetical protein
MVGLLAEDDDFILLAGEDCHVKLRVLESHAGNCRMYDMSLGCTHMNITALYIS